ncbi:hypothetical protein Bca52824_029634 [Brassica carinata]|uniref:Oleosin n=1 Tax=Brassica carinata TaxID=52824 RepID=A0A8X7VEL0_BRACI|nr:hypothetical protein Bca52824_029634 [Brassica carinata]
MADLHQHQQPMTRNLHESSSSPSTTNREIPNGGDDRHVTAGALGINAHRNRYRPSRSDAVDGSFSPVLVPAVITMCLLTAGFLFSGGCGVAAATALSWIYRYVTGKHPMGADKVDYARMMISEKAKELGHYAQAQTDQTTSTPY